MIFVTVETDEEERVVREGLTRLPVSLPFAIRHPGGGGEYASEPPLYIPPRDSGPYPYRLGD